MAIRALSDLYTLHRFEAKILPKIIVGPKPETTQSNYKITTGIYFIFKKL